MNIKLGISTRISIGISALLLAILSIGAYTLLSWSAFLDDLSQIANKNITELSVSSDARRSMTDISALSVKMDHARSSAEIRVLKNSILENLDQLDLALSQLIKKKSVSILKQHLTVIRENTFDRADISEETLMIQQQLLDKNNEILAAHQFIVRGLLEELSRQSDIGKIKNWYEMFDQLTNKSLRLPGLTRSFEIKQNAAILSKESDLLVPSFPFTRINPDTFKMIKELALLINGPKRGLIALVVRKSGLVATQRRLNTQNLIVIDEALILALEVFEAEQLLTKNLAVQLENEVIQSRYILIFIGILSFLTFIAFYFFVQKNVIRRLEAISLEIQKGYEGRSAVIRDNGLDEIGDIARSIRQFMDKIFKQQKELKNNEAHLRKVIESAPQAIFIFEDIKILFANSRAQEFIQSSPNNDLLGFSQELFESYEENLSLVKSGRQVYLGRFKLSGNDGWKSVV